MGDAVRPDEDVFRGVYERGYRTWAALWQTAVDDSRLPAQPFLETSLYSAFPNHPHFPERLLLDKSFVNVVTASGKTTWTTTSTPECCDLPPFQEEVVMQVAWNRSTEITFRQDEYLEKKLKTLFSPDDSHHFPILFFAWAYILSARWAELVPDALAPTYNNEHEDKATAGDDTETSPEPVVVEIGDVDGDAARWWTAVLSTGSGWGASIRNDRGDILCSPWSIRTPSETFFTMSTKHKSHDTTTSHPASFKTATRYLSKYCRLHSSRNRAKLPLQQHFSFHSQSLKGEESTYLTQSAVRTHRHCSQCLPLAGLFRRGRRILDS